MVECDNLVFRLFCFCYVRLFSFVVFSFATLWRNNLTSPFSVLAYFPYFEKKIKTKGGLWDHLAVCLSAHLSVYLSMSVYLFVSIHLSIFHNFFRLTRLMISPCCLYVPLLFSFFCTVRIAWKARRRLVLLWISFFFFFFIYFILCPVVCCSCLWKLFDFPCTSFQFLCSCYSLSDSLFVYLFV
jgi:hypothetical protein